MSTKNTIYRTNVSIKVQDLVNFKAVNAIGFFILKQPILFKIMVNGFAVVVFEGNGYGD